MKIIDNFDNENAFLSNFYPASVTLDGIVFPTVEHAYQAAKTLDIERRKTILNKTPGQAKRVGKKFSLRPEWEKIKIEIMASLVQQKFTSHQDLRESLLSTGDAVLIEGNCWNDTFWGICKGQGQNHLGKILMQVREQLLKSSVEFTKN